MDANKVHEQSRDLVQKLGSTDPADLDYAINQYFEDHATLEHEHISVSGISKIKKIVNLGSYVRGSQGKVLKEPKYDSNRQLIQWSNVLDNVSPRLPSYIPFHVQLSSQRTVVEWDWVAHLAPNTDDQGDGGAKGQKLFVTKLEGRQKHPFILDRVVPRAIARPLVTLICLTIANLVIFFRAHKGEGLIQLFLSAIVDTFNAVWGMLLSETSRRQAQAERWGSEKAPQLQEYYNQAYTSANQAYSSALDISSKVQADLEARAKSAGIPVDDYKQRAAQAVADLTENVEARAKAAGLPVEEYKKQAEAFIEEMRKRAGDVAAYVDERTQGVQKDAKSAADGAKKKVNGVKKDVQKKADEVTQDNAPVNGDNQRNGEVNAEQRAKEIRAEFAETPQTPLGGHDPTAPNAPSFAAAAAL